MKRKKRNHQSFGRLPGLVLVILVLASTVFVHDSRAQVVSNLTFVQQGSFVRIQYDLDGEKSEYTIALSISFNGGLSFTYVPEFVTGQVGEDVSPGKRKTIVWNLSKEFPEGLQSDQIAFEVSALSQSGGRGLLYTIVGGIIAGGGATAALLLKGATSTSSTSPEDPDPTFPAPPTFPSGN